jgi:quercetin dioxygenase-like cupin family protein
MQTASGADGRFERGNEDWFTGDVWVRSTLTADDGTNVGIVQFSPGARTHWHRHPGGQFLVALTGRGRVRTRGEPAFVLQPGDVVHVEPEEWHWHGAEDDAPMTHVAVNGGGAPEWAEAVTDEEYADGS